MIGQPGDNVRQVRCHVVNGLISARRKIYGASRGRGGIIIVQCFSR
jgi:hypothetical protein